MDEEDEEFVTPAGPSAARRTRSKRELTEGKEIVSAKKKKPDLEPDDEERPEPSRSSGPVLPVNMDAEEPSTDEEAGDSDDTLFYPEEDSGDALLIVDEADWRGLSDNHRLASNTASFSFVTSMEGVVQDISSLSTKPTTYSSLFSGSSHESRASSQMKTMSEDDPQKDALSRALRRHPTRSSRECFGTKQEPFSYYQALSAILSDSRQRDGHPRESWESFLTRPDRSRKEVSATDRRAYQKQFAEAKRVEYESWLEHDVFELVDLRKVKPKNFVQGRWVLTIKRRKDGSFDKCKARWVLKGFQDRQKSEQQTDSPTASRPGFRLTCQFGANHRLPFYHIDIKTAFYKAKTMTTTETLSVLYHQKQDILLTSELE